ncbi:uncharacterized protein LOC142814582 isoform X4 [Rhipicephalus microplus]|uniref:uncharacterized protein LOC119160752 isoform X4 n=2 Tax=Rhipicephalus microplus TaxID=6941 RepID=UPI00188809F2|nr:uncharacterized protein LOC119161512 isoform X2 [Rhipicephalus microplus]XP_037270900.1 uncharacterized protein LOC119163071 isoform X2 [Rhipicephalus microplus]XP_037287118.1 uncharacterized protein LOC119180079 isoform X2 [Rhipicephalus microplus]XP_037291439.1 uncharacterized protein LOC119187394 isoform X2 [Rhipicephalus microplus]
MFALVRFLDSDHAHDTRRYVVRVEDIHDFHPKHETDFDGKAVYVVHWEDEANGDDTGEYKAQILRLGATEKEARESPKRIPIPKIAVEEGSDVEGAVTKKATAARMKKTAVNRTAAKKDRYEQILKKQMSHALRQNSEQTRKTRLSSSSSSDDSLVSSSEVTEEKKKTKFWKKRCKELRQDNIFLQEQVSSQQVLLNSKFLRFEDLQHSKEADVESCTVQARKETAKATSNLVKSIQETVPGSPNAGSLHSRSAIDDFIEEPPTSMTACAAKESDDLPSPRKCFSYLEDGSFHLQKGICLTPIQAKRILSHKKARLVVKETAQAIWSQKGLASRSVKGGVAPGRRNLGEVAKPALTPEKVAVLEETLNHWSHVTGADSSIAARNLTSILTEKIQDCIKAERRKPPQ